MFENWRFNPFSETMNSVLVVNRRNFKLDAAGLSSSVAGVHGYATIGETYIFLYKIIDGFF